LQGNGDSTGVLIGYTVAIGGFIGLIKVVTWYLHRAFDMEKKFKLTEENDEDAKKTLHMEEGETLQQSAVKPSKQVTCCFTFYIVKEEDPKEAKEAENKDSDEETLQKKPRDDASLQKSKESPKNLTSTAATLGGRDSEGTC
jgi:hypothetical protein